MQALNRWVVTLYVSPLRPINGCVRCTGNGTTIITCMVHQSAMCVHYANKLWLCRTPLKDPPLTTSRQSWQRLLARSLIALQNRHCRPGLQNSRPYSTRCYPPRYKAALCYAMLYHATHHCRMAYTFSTVRSCSKISDQKLMKS